jgi:glutamate mutase epsilon subunit
MPFRLTNAPAMLMDFRNQVLKSYLDKYVVVFVDDILVYSKSLMDHKQHLRNVCKCYEKTSCMPEQTNVTSG